MTPFLGTYDFRRTIPAPYSAFLDAAERHGWYHWIADDGTGRRYRLPNTTVHGWFVDYNAAARAFDAALAEAASNIGIGIEIEKWIIVERGVARFSSDVVLPKYRPQLRALGLG